MAEAIVGDRGRGDAKNEEGRTFSCSFCGKMQDEVQRLIAGPGVYICNECVELCESILEEGGNFSRRRSTTTFPPNCRRRRKSSRDWTNM